MTRTKTRALANWPNNAVSVLDFGATGDGVTDDTAAIQACFDYVDALPPPTASFGRGGTSIFFPDGTYRCDSPLYAPVRDNLTLFGSGSSAIYGTHGGVTLTLGDADVKSTINNSILNLEFTGSNGTNDTALLTQRTYALTVDKCTFANAHTGYHHNAGVHDYIRGCEFRHLANQNVAQGFNIRIDNIEDSSGTVHGNSGIHILDCEMNGGADANEQIQANIYIRHMDGIYISNCHMKFAKYGLWVDPDGLNNNGIATIQASNTYFDRIGTHNVLLSGQVLNTGTTDGTTGIYHDLQFNNCYFRASGDVGFRVSVDAATDAKLQGLQISDCQFRSSQKVGFLNSTVGLEQYSIKDCLFDGCGISEVDGTSAIADTAATNASIGGNVIVDSDGLITTPKSAAITITPISSDSNISVIDNQSLIATESSNPIFIANYPRNSALVVRDSGSNITKSVTADRDYNGIVDASGGALNLGLIPFLEGQSATLSYDVLVSSDTNPAGNWKASTGKIHIARVTGESVLTVTDLVAEQTAGIANVTINQNTTFPASGLFLFSFRIVNSFSKEVRATFRSDLIMHS